MSKKRGSNNRQGQADKILTAGGLTQAEIDAGRKRAALHRVTDLTNALTVFVTAGGGILKDQYNFTERQVADWATETIRAAREIVKNA